MLAVLNMRRRRGYKRSIGRCQSYFWLLLISLPIMTGCRPSDTESKTNSPESGNTETSPALSTNSTAAGNDSSQMPIAGSPKPNNTAAESIYKDVAQQAGIQSVYRNGQEAGEASIVESLGGGVAVLDVNNDGFPDFFFPGGGEIAPNKLSPLPGKMFLNLDGTEFIDISQLSSTNATVHYSHGASASDFDNDGFTDLLVTGYGGLVLWHNQGDGTFQRCDTEAGLSDSLWSSSAAWGDITGDGLVDLYVAHYVNWSWDNHPLCRGPNPGQRDVCSPGDFKGLDDTLYVNRGDGTFEDASKALGLVSGGKGLGVVMHDLNQDGTLDIYIANDTEPNFCYLNRDGKLQEQAHRMGIAIDDEGIPNGSMGVDMCDYNRDGRPDLWAANYERESFALYRNEGNGFFLHVSRSSGITALGGLFVGFGTSFVDINGDGWEDILVSNGHVIKYPIHATRRQRPLMLINRNGKFVRQRFTDDDFFSQEREGRGLALTDFNRDGYPDVAIAHLNEPAALLQHHSKLYENFLVLKLVGTTSSRDPIGAKATLVTDSQPIVRFRKGGGSYLSSSEASLFFAWPKFTTIKELKIRWPSGIEQSIAASDLSDWMTVVEPTDSSPVDTTNDEESAL